MNAPPSSFGGIAIDDRSTPVSELEAAEWIVSWAGIGGGVTIDHAGSLHPWVLYSPKTADRLLAELRETAGLAAAVRNHLTAASNDWERLRLNYEAALSAESVYRMATWGPHYDRCMAERMAIPRDIEAEMERLENSRGDVEDALLRFPATSLEQVIVKLLICHADGRELDIWDDQICIEARALLPRDRYNFVTRPQPAFISSRPRAPASRCAGISMPGVAAPKSASPSSLRGPASPAMTSP